MIEHDRKKLLKVINLIKDIGMTTDDKCPITYNQVCELQDAEYVLPKKILTDEFNTFCKLVYPKTIHVNAPEYVEGSIERVVPDFTASPHVLNGGGTVMYGKPGMGKSYTALAMAISIASRFMAIVISDPAETIPQSFERSPFHLS